MAREFRLWMEPDPVTARPAARAARVPPPQRVPRPAQPEGDSDWPLGGPWALLLAFLNLERRVPPPDWPRHQEGMHLAPDWDAWRQFRRETAAPYLLTMDQGHPLIWFPATDGDMWGFLFNFGLRGGGGWYWAVPGTERIIRDPTTGTTTIILGETHPEVPDGKTIRELLEAAPHGLFDVDRTEFLTVQEVLDKELRRHSADERNRCRFIVYPAAAPSHERLIPHTELGLQTAEAQRENIALVAWTCLSPQVALWGDIQTYDWRLEIGGHSMPEPDDDATERELARLTPAERFRRMAGEPFWDQEQNRWGLRLAPDGNPLARFMQRRAMVPRFVPETSARVLGSVRRKAAGHFAPEAAPEHRREQQQAAQRRLGRAMAVKEECITSDIFAAVAQQVVWAVQVGLTIRACEHPECGRAFIPETGKYRYCPEHRGGTARSQRSRGRPQRTPPQEQ